MDDLSSSDFSRCHTGAYSSSWSRFVDFPLICMTTLSYEIHVRLMIRFHFESFSQILLSDTVAVLGRSYVECLDPHVTILVGVHIRSFTHPHGVILGLSGRIGYIWCHTREYFPPLAMEAIILSHTRYSFHHSVERYCVRLTDHYSWGLHRDKLAVERSSRLLESLSAISSGLRFAAACHTGAYFPLIVSLRSGVQSRRSFTVYDIQSYHVTLSVRRSEPLL